MTTRTPDEILDDLDSFAGTQEELAQLRGLMWEVIEDIRSSYRLAMLSPDLDWSDAFDGIENTVNGYIGNHYGDD